MANGINVGHDYGQAVAAADYSAKQFYIVDISANNTVTVASSAGQACFGVLQNAPESGEVASVRYGGVSKVVAGTGGLAAGDLVQAAADGTAIDAASGDYTIGMCVIGASAGESATIVVMPSAGQLN
jgi:hypothetical protein